MLIFTTCPNSIPLKYTFKMMKYKRTILKYINLLENIYMIFFLKNINKLQILIIYSIHKCSFIVTKSVLCIGLLNFVMANIKSPFDEYFKPSKSSILPAWWVLTLSKAISIFFCLFVVYHLYSIEGCVGT